jgi:hypothetical protein
MQVILSGDQQKVWSLASLASFSSHISMTRW